MLSLHMKKELVAATTNSGRGLLKVLVEADHDHCNRDQLFYYTYACTTAKIILFNFN